jgi:2-iminoacetate synthase ThiH
VDWQQYGPKLAQVALMFGANHLDRVSPIDDPALGPRRASAEEVRRNIIAAGFTPADANEAQ